MDKKDKEVIRQTVTTGFETLQSILLLLTVNVLVSSNVFRHISTIVSTLTQNLHSAILVFA